MKNLFKSISQQNIAKFVFQSSPSPVPDLSSSPEWLKAQLKKEVAGDLGNLMDDIENGVSKDEVKQIFAEIDIATEWNNGAPKNSARYVLALQSALHILGYGGKVGTVDAMFGGKTKAGIREFQKAWNEKNQDKEQLTVDGQPGPKTLPKLLAALDRDWEEASGNDDNNDSATEGDGNSSEKEEDSGEKEEAKENLTGLEKLEKERKDMESEILTLEEELQKMTDSGEVYFMDFDKYQEEFKKSEQFFYKKLNHDNFDFPGWSLIGTSKEAQKVRVAIVKTFKDYAFKNRKYLPKTDEEFQEFLELVGKNNLESWPDQKSFNIVFFNRRDSVVMAKPLKKGTNEISEEYEELRNKKWELEKKWLLKNDEILFEKATPWKVIKKVSVGEYGFDDVAFRSQNGLPVDKMNNTFLLRYDEKRKEVEVRMQVPFEEITELSFGGYVSKALLEKCKNLESLECLAMGDFLYEEEGKKFEIPKSLQKLRYIKARHVEFDPDNFPALTFIWDYENGDWEADKAKWADIIRKNAGE